MNRRFFFLFYSAFLTSTGIFLNPVLPQYNYNNIVYAEESAEFYLDKGIQFLKTGQFNEALEELRKAVKLKPDDAKIHYNLGLPYQQLGFLDEAITEFDLSEKIAMNKNPVVKDIMQNKSPAKQVNHKENPAKPAPPEVRINNQPHSLMNFKTEKIPPQNVETRETEIIIKQDLPSVSEVNENPQKQKSSRVSRLIASGYGYYLQGKYQEAINSYKKALSFDPRNVQGNYELGVIYQDMGNLPEAIIFYQKTITINPNYIDAYKKLAFIKATSGDIIEATKLYEKVISFDPNDSKAYFMLGKLLKENGNNQKAYEALEKSIVLDPNNAKAYKELIEVSEQLGLKDKAAQYKTRSSSKDILSTNEYLTMAQRSLQNGNYNQASDEFKKILLIDPGNLKAKEGLSESLYQSAISFKERNYLSYAIQLLQKSLENNPGNVKSAFELAKVYQSNGKESMAIDILQKASKYTNSPDLHYDLAQNYLKTSNFDAALLEFEEVLRADQGYKDAAYQMGKIYIALGETDKAEKLLENIVNSNSTDQAHLDLANIYYKSGKVTKALSHYEETLRLNPNAYQAYVGIGLIQMLQNQDDAAIGNFQKALEFNKSDPHVHFYLGQLYQSKEETQKAATEFQEAANNSQGFAQAHYFAGLMNAKIGNHAKALTHFEKVLSIDPDYPDVSEEIPRLYLSAA